MSVNFHTLCDCLEQLWIQARTAKGFSSALFPRLSHPYRLYPLPLMVQFHEHPHHLQAPAHLELLLLEGIYGQMCFYMP
jgi:hypothetical protein